MVVLFRDELKAVKSINFIKYKLLNTSFFHIRCDKIEICKSTSAANQRETLVLRKTPD